LIGFDADAPRGKLYIDPMLPDWLPDLHLIDFRLGKKVFDLRFGTTARRRASRW